MEAMTWAFIGTLIGAITGAASSVLTTYLNTKNSAKIQLNAIASQRSDRLREAQGKYLMELQESFADLMRALTQVHLSDLTHFADNDKNGSRNIISNELDERVRSTNQKVTYLSERILDDPLRKSINVAHQAMNGIAIATTRDASKQALVDARQSYQDLTQKMGVAIRGSLDSVA